ncbi:hypothetical protein Ciccas_002691 [Cichlidogyrus casuarinus]|uniref:C2H2-type domain-containing protein n=1 Tax=Cichlidogyrus casuarinus TaxID=1844966 RepID=A0ABD2QJR1_9PLAT
MATEKPDARARVLYVYADDKATLVRYDVISRREEMIRHIKWHRKREESLQYGFMRYSPSDDCRNHSCVHNGKQTHYHCLQANCSKIYISTSDVQMHANYHRKDAVIMQDGFQRFRATENCGLESCPFQNERTTHFHCRRPECLFTFKNKADIEKHKSHHQRNDSFAKDGFKKFIKYESCDYSSCKYSRIMNHIHCIRPGCDYVVHSSSQILSHKRKHERRQIPEPFGCSSFNFGTEDEESRFPMTQGIGQVEAIKILYEKIKTMVLATLSLLRVSESAPTVPVESLDFGTTEPLAKELFFDLHKRIVLADGHMCNNWQPCDEKYGHFHCSWPKCFDRRGPLFRYRSHWIRHAWTGALIKVGP